MADLKEAKFDLIIFHNVPSIAWQKLLSPVMVVTLRSHCKKTSYIYFIFIAFSDRAQLNW